MHLKQYLRKKVYRWHRITSLIVALPVLLWTVSGFLHPVMNSMKPDVRNQFLANTAIDTSRVKLTLSEALLQNGIEKIERFRIVNLYGSHYYQVRLLGKDTLSYISCFNAQWLPKGDEQYAGFLAQRYLTEPGGQKGGDHHGGAAANINEPVLQKAAPAHYIKPNIKEVSFVENFNSEYKKSNLLLPVYKVSFYREDGVRLYVETLTDRLAAAMDDKRAAYTVFFGAAHSWNFLDGLGIAKNIVLAFVSMLCFLTSLLGFYVYNISKSKKQAKQGTTSRRWHRALGNVFVLTTLLYAFSGAWHSFHKIGKKETAGTSLTNAVYQSADLNGNRNWQQLLRDKEALLDLTAVTMDGNIFWMATLQKDNKKYRRYIAARHGKVLQEGEKKYGAYLAGLYTGTALTAKDCKTITSFGHGYSMMHKRLPVVAATRGQTTYYIETATGMLAAVVNSQDRAERFSFSNLHMHHYWEMWFGKKRGQPFKNAILISSTLGLLMLAITGTLLYARKKMKKKQQRDIHDRNPTYV